MKKLKIPLLLAYVQVRFAEEKYRTLSFQKRMGSQRKLTFQEGANLG